MWINGQKRLQDVGNSQTNDLGEYRIFWALGGAILDRSRRVLATSRETSRAILALR
jgi:hypothetical protein